MFHTQSQPIPSSMVASGRLFSGEPRISAVTQPIRDVIVRVPYETLERLGYAKGSYNPRTPEEVAVLLGEVKHCERWEANGSTGYNALSAASRLGSSGDLVGLIGDDNAGSLFREQARQEEIHLSLPPIPGAMTAVCVSLVTPDGERTMVTSLGVAAQLGRVHLENVNYAGTRWLLLDGYFLVGSDENYSAFYEALSAVSGSAAKGIFPVSSEHVAQLKREEILESILPRIHLLAANEREALALTGAPDVPGALSALERRVPAAIITAGAAGSWTSHEGQRFFTPAVTSGTQVVDTTGAGDAYLGAFVAGVMQGVTPREASAGAARIAAMAVSNYTARLPQFAREEWWRAIETA